MGSKSTSKQIEWITLKEVVNAAAKKFPGYNYQTQLLEYYRLLVTICAKKKNPVLQAHLNLLTLLMNSIENLCTGVSR